MRQSVHLIANLEARNTRAERGDLTRQIEPKNQRQILQSRQPQTSSGLPIHRVDSDGVNPDQYPARYGFWYGNRLEPQHVRIAELVRRS